MRPAGVDQHLLDDLGLEQVLEGAVDRGLGHPVVGAAHVREQFVGLKDPVLAQHRVEDQRPLCGELQPLTLKEAAEDRAHRGGLRVCAVDQRLEVVSRAAEAICGILSGPA